MKKILLVIDLLLLLLIFSPMILKKLGWEDAAIFRWIPKQTEETDSFSFGDNENHEIESTEFIAPPESTEPIVPPESSETETEGPSAAWEDFNRPDDADFLDWFVRDVYQNGVPKDVDRITEFGEVTGEWKAMLYLDPGNEHGQETIRLFNVVIDAGQDALEMTVCWYSAYWFDDDASYSEENYPSLRLTGTWSDGRFLLSGDTEVDITDFYRQNGKEYAVGDWYADGMEGYFALVRP